MDRHIPGCTATCILGTAKDFLPPCTAAHCGQNTLIEGASQQRRGERCALYCFRWNFSPSNKQLDPNGVMQDIFVDSPWTWESVIFQWCLLACEFCSV